MTYNFDPERWYQIERDALDSARRAGDVTPTEFKRRLGLIDRQFASMLSRLDGTYQIPSGGGDDKRKA